jgi:hypothetical protein
VRHLDSAEDSPRRFRLKGEQFMTTMEATTTTVELPVEFDPRWNRMAGITVEGRQITVDPEQYFFKFDPTAAACALKPT